MTTATASTLWQGEPYSRSATVLHVVVHGTAASQGSKSYVGQSRSGRAILIESSKALKPWRAHVQTQIETAIRNAADPGLFPLIGPLGIDLVFTMPKPKSAPKTRVTYPIVQPDVDKLARAVLDACTYAHLWGDDAQAVAVSAWKVYPSETPRSLTQPGVAIAVHTLTNPTSPALPQRTELPL